MPEFFTTPAFYAVCAAVLLGFTSIPAKMSFRYLEPFAASSLTIGVTAAFFWMLTPAFVRVDEIILPALLVFCALGVFQPFITLALSYQANHLLGPTRATAVASISPIFAIAGAVVLLGESVTAPILLGTLGVVAGVIIISRQDSTHRAWAVATLLLPLTAAAIRGFGSLGFSYGLGLLPNAILAGTAAYSVAALLGLAVFLLRPGAKLRPVPLPAVLYILAAGLMSGFGIIFVLLALKTGRVVVVTPIVSSFPLATLLGSVLWFRKEAITPRLILGMALIVPSVAVIGYFR